MQTPSRHRKTMAQNPMRPILFAACLALATPSYADVARPDTIADTLELLVTAIREAGFPNAVIDVENRSVVSDPDDDNSYITYPDNLHRSLQNATSDDERQAILDGFVAPLSEGLDNSGDFAADRVMPVLRPLDYLDGVGEEAAVQTRPFAGDMMIAYVLDYPTHTTSISPDVMTDAGYDADGLHDLAMANLRTAAANLAVEGSEVGIYFLSLDGYYENAMLLYAPLWDRITEQIGPVAVTVPARDFVMIAPRSEPALVKMMADIRDQALLDSPYPISARTFSWDKGRWSVLPD